MTSEDKRLSYDEKNGSGSSDVEPVEAGHVSSTRRRFPGFSLEVRQEESSFAATKSASNADFDPIPPSRRTWTMGAYVAYWMADAWAVSNWEVGEFPMTSFACEVRERSGAETLAVQLLL
jgi:nucleobase:cation symporter-1, NCS1 family